MKESQSLKLARKFLGQEVEIIIDKPLNSKHPKHGFLYEVNFGYIPGTKAPDGGEKANVSPLSTAQTMTMINWLLYLRA
jgi:hypothetical protein